MSLKHTNTQESFRKLRVWQNVHDLVVKVYKVTAVFPISEQYGLTSQMRRAAVSVVANIVEGSKRHSVKDRIHFHSMANGSLEELKYYFLLSMDLSYVSSKECESLLEIARGVGAMLHGLTKSLRESV